MTVILVRRIIGLVLLAAAIFLIIRQRSEKKAMNARLKEIRNIERGGPSARTTGNGNEDKDGVFSKMSRRLDDSFYNAGLRLGAGTAAPVWIALVLGLPVLMSFFGVRTVFCIAAVAVLAALPFAVMKISRKRRANRFEEQLVDAIEVMNSALKAGYSFQSSLQVVAEASEDPAREEFSMLFNEIQLGARFDDALRNMSERIGSRDVDIFCTALNVQSATGGNLIMVLSNIAETIKTRLRIKKEIKAKTASGKLSGFIVGALPFLLFLIIRILNPDYILPFIGTQKGRMILLGAGVLMVIGFFIIRKIVDVEY